MFGRMKQQTKTRIPASEWAERVAGWQASGLSADEYGRRIGIGGKQLSWWKWQLGKRERQSGSDVSGKRRRRIAEAAPSLLPVRVVTRAGRAALRADRPIEVLLHSGRRLRLHVADEQELMWLVAVLERATPC